MAKRPNALADALAARVLSSPSNQPTTGYGRIPQGTSSGPALGVGFAPQASQTKQWQQFLSTQGYYTGAVDGKFGPDTRLATMAFQHAMGLAPDGIVGDQTRYAQALYSSVPGKELDA